MPEPFVVRPERARPSTLGLSPAIRLGDLVFVSGQVPVDLATGELEGEDITAQTASVMSNLGEVLEAAGCSLADVVKTTVFLTDASDFAAMDASYRSFFADRYPARSTVTIAALARPAFRVEIEAIARFASDSE